MPHAPCPMLWDRTVGEPLRRRQSGEAGRIMFLCARKSSTYSTMMDDRPTAHFTITRQAESRLASGHRWVYEQELAAVSGVARAGDVVEVATCQGRSLGRGLYSPGSKIRVRLLTRIAESIDEGWWSRRLQAAVALRTRTVSGTTAYRLVHADADELPGLIVDRYGDTVVMQLLTVGMDRRRERLTEVLQPLVGARAVYLRNDSPARALEGLPTERGFLRGRGATTIEIQEGSAKFLVDIERGQKTGWFCDQRENRLTVAALARGRDVLDAFSYTGGFGVQAAVAGARSVAGFDASRSAVEQARAHARLNQVSGVCDFRTADAVDALKKLGRSRKRFDVVVVDPPAFAKRRVVRSSALEGYQSVNALALPLVRSWGLLVTCSCSHHVSETDLCAVVEAAARKARRRIQIVERRGAGPDHPVLASMPETHYLKCLIVKVH